MKLCAIPILLFSFISLSFSMEDETQSDIQTSKGPTKTMKRIDGFVEALKEMEVKDEKALLNFRHKFFTAYARELAEGTHAKALGDECSEFLNETLKKFFGKDEANFQELYTLCVFTSVMLSGKTKETGGDDVLENCRKFLQQKTLTKEKFGSPQFYEAYLQKLVKTIYKTGRNETTAFITMCTQYTFYPLILIYNQFFRMEDYFYALSKRVRLLSHPYKPSTGLHGGQYSEPIEVINHDIAHINHFSETYSGFCPFLSYKPINGENMIYKCDMYERVGQYFFDLLQRKDIDETSKKKLKEIGLNLTHENFSHKDVKFPSDKTLKSDLGYLIICLKKCLERTFLPDCLETLEKFKSSLASSYITFLKLKHPNDMPAKMNRNLVKVTDNSRPQTFDVTYKTYQVTDVCYESHKRNNSDWVRSAQRLGFTGKMSEDCMKYSPAEARKFHLELLAWFEKNYLSKI